MIKKTSSNPIVIRPDTNIGNSSAEADDEFLFKCFLEHPVLETLQDYTSSKKFVSGRTGTGKTAILRMVAEKNPHKSVFVDLPDMALNYVANSDIIQFLNALGVDLDLFFQALWKHVLCLEYIRLRFKVDNEDKSISTFERLTEAFKKDKTKDRALKYLEDWQSKFWITMDENIKEITRKLEEGIDAELAIEVDKFKGRSGYARTLSSEKKSALVARAKKIVNSGLLSDLSKVLDMLGTYEQKEKYKDSYYLLIDKLDEKWVDDEIRFDLIRSLIECLKSFGRLESLKVLVAMRSDVIEKVVQDNLHLGFQREKYDDYFLKLRWNKEQLRELVEKRISYLYKRKYNSDSVSLYDVFEEKVGNTDTFDFILERTLYRPRDIISFINLCLQNAEGSSKVTQRQIKDAESEYSRIRLQALIQEWQSSFPTLEIAFELLSGRGGRFQPSEMSTKEFLTEFILVVDDRIELSNDPIYKAVKIYLGNESPERLLNVAKILFSILYRIGAVGLKLAPNERYLYAYKDISVVSENTVNIETKLQIHPMLHRALNVSS